MQSQLSRELVASKTQKIHLLRVIEDLTKKLKQSWLDEKMVREATGQHALL